MFFVLKSLNSFLKLLNSETAPSQIAAGMAFGLLVGLSPTTSLHNLIFLLLVFLFRVNLTMFFLSTAVFKLMAFALDPVFDKLGYWVLVDLKPARPLWVHLTTGAVWPFFKLNNTIVMGSLSAGLILFIPIFIFCIVGVRTYRARWREQIKNSKFMKAMKATPLYGLYEKYQNLRQKLSVFQ